MHSNNSWLVSYDSQQQTIFIHDLGQNLQKEIIIIALIYVSFSQLFIFINSYPIVSSL